MNLDETLKHSKQHKKAVSAGVKALKEIARFDQDRLGNMAKIERRLKKIEKCIAELDRTPNLRERLSGWVASYEKELEGTRARQRKKFGGQLEKELKPVGMSLTGQYPELRAGLFTVEVNFGKGKAVIWYGPKQERLDKCQLSVPKVAAGLQEARDKLGADMAPPDFLEALEKAYNRTDEGHQGNPAPIIAVLGELAFLMQTTRFFNDPRRRNYKGYSRADFSYDLFRLRRFRKESRTNMPLHLEVATRSHTRRRADFLWVPDDEKTGKGTTYSHLRWE